MEEKELQEEKIVVEAAEEIKSEKPETKKKEKKRRRWSVKDLVPGILLSLAASFMLFLYGPLEWYFTNKNEFWFDIRMLLPVVLKTFGIVLAASIVIMIVLYVIHERVYQAALTVYFVAFLATYIQGNFLVGSLPALDGTAVNWGDYTAEHVKTIAVWVVIAIIVGVCIHIFHMGKMYVAYGLIPLCMTLMLATTLVSLCMSNDGFEHKIASDLSITTKNELQMSKDQKNFIILVLDAVDGGAFNSVMESTPEDQEIFADFTFYKDTMGVYPFTKHAIPYMISGEYYENEGAYDVYLKNAYATSPLLSRLKNESYKLGIYEDEFTPNDDSISAFDNTDQGIGSVTSEKKFAELEVKLTGFKYAPYLLKEQCFFAMEDFKNLRQEDEKNPLFSSNNMDFYDALRDKEITYSEESCFKFIHLEGAHVPFRYTKDMSYISDDSGTYTENVEANVTIAKAYLEKLKEAGVYDNSVIIIMADHGYNYDNTEGRMNPLLLVKGVGESHEYQVNNAPISFEDLQDAYGKLLDGSSSSECFTAKEGDVRSRRFLFYKYSKEENMTEYRQSGFANDLTTLTPTGVEYKYDEKNKKKEEKEEKKSGSEEKEKNESGQDK